MKVWELRQTYRKSGLSEDNLPDTPYRMLTQWMEQAIQAEVTEPNAMSLATVKPDDTPDVRMVLLKEIETEGVTFYTNYHSQKAKDLDNRPHAACCFWWQELERQIRIRGPVERISRELSAAYFANRPRLSQIGAWASVQSQVIGSREVLELAAADQEKRYEDREVPLPDHWGGFRIHFRQVEFWQGRPGRMHDRILYRREDDHWSIQRLSP